MTESYETQIELKPCGACPGGRYRSAGPDARNLGIFNYNNRILFTHDLLDDYTLAFTSSETPFAAWVGVVHRRYARFLPGRAFVKPEVFRAAWFAYAALQSLEADLQCPDCGPYPEDTIWDGVTLAFHQKHLLPSLQPPTLIHEKSIIRNSRYLQDQPLLVNKNLRKLLQKVVAGRSLILTNGFAVNENADVWINEDEDNDNEEDDINITASQAARAEKAKSKVISDVCERIEAIPGLTSQLSSVNTCLGQLFLEHFGLQVITAGVAPPQVYLKLFKQVFHVLLAPYKNLIAEPRFPQATLLYS